MTSSHAFQSDWCSPPGQTVQDVIEHRQIRCDDFAVRMDLTSDAIRDLLAGTLAITEQLAERLSGVLGSTPEFWLAREQQYRADVKRLGGHRAVDEDREWLRGLPVADMIRYGWISTVTAFSDKVDTCLNFFEAESIADWRSRTEVNVAFRTSPAFESRPGALAAWLRQGAIQAENIKCGPWDRTKFEASLPTLRSLTRKSNPQTFITQLTEACATCGVAVVVVRAPKGCHASGATRFLSSQKAVLMLSFRHLSDDQFWFTFFHEAGHLVLHGAESFFVEWEHLPSSKEENEADEFAANTLVPSEARDTMLALPAKAMAIIRFAHEIGVSPGIVVGQMQHYGRLRRDQLNFVKRRFKWSE